MCNSGKLGVTLWLHLYLPKQYALEIIYAHDISIRLNPLDIPSQTALSLPTCGTSEPCSCKVDLSRVLVSAVASAAAAAGIAAAQQAASSINLEDEAGPSSSAAGQAASAAEDTMRTYLTLFGKADDCKAAELAIRRR